jgi:hypothetical protein
MEHRPMNKWDESKNRPKSLREQFREFQNSQNDNAIKVYSPHQDRKFIDEHPELRMTDNPAHMQLTQYASDPDAQEMLQTVIEQKDKEAFESGDRFWGNYVRTEDIKYPHDFVKVGTTRFNAKMGFGASKTKGNIAYVGQTRSGKTSNFIGGLARNRPFLENNCLVAVVKKREIRDLSILPEVGDLVTVFKIEELKFSLLEPPPGVPEHAWGNEITRLVAHCYGRFSAQRLLSDIIADLLSHHPVGVYPTLRQIIEVLEKFKPRFGLREASYKESILWCLKSLLTSTRRVDGSSIWDFSSSDMLDKLYNEPCLKIIEADAVPQEDLTFVTTYMMRWIYFKRLYSGIEAGARLVCHVCDDIMTGTTKDLDSDSPSGIAPFAECLIMQQRYNMGSIILIQSLSELSCIIRQNIQTWLLFATVPDNPQLLCNTICLDASQVQRVSCLKLGEFIIFNPDLADKPQLARFEEVRFPRVLDESERRRIVDKFFANVKTAPPAPLTAFTPSAGPQGTDGDKGMPMPELPTRGLEFMVVVHIGIPRPITKYYDQMNISRAAGAKLTQHVELLGLIRVHQFSTGKRGGKVSLVEITPEGWKLLEGKGFTRKKKKTGGAFEHDAAADLVEADGRKKGSAVTFEEDVGGLRVDVLLTDPKSGSKTLVNIGVSNVQRECDSIEKFLNLPISKSSEFILVARDSDFVRAVESELKKRGIPIDTLANVHMKLLADYLEL